MTRSNISCARFCFALALLLIAAVSALGQRRRPTPGVYEGENLVNSGKTNVNGGSVSAQPMTGFGSGWSGNAQLFWGGGQVGAVLDVTLDVAEDGMYEVKLHMTRAPDFGRLRIQVNNKNVAERFDGYAPTVTPSGAVSLGTFALHRGTAKISFMIDGKNPQSSNFFAGIDFIRLQKTSVQSSNELKATNAQSLAGSTIRPPKITTQLSKTLSDDSAAIWNITFFGMSPDPSVPGPEGKMAYMEGQGLNIKCSYELTKPGQGKVFVGIFDSAGGGGIEDAEFIKDGWVDQGGELTTFYWLKSGGYVHHFVGCGAWIQTDPAKPAENSSLKFVDVYVVKGIVPKETKWPDAPIIQTPIQGGKIVIKSFNPSSPHCTDGGSFFIEMQMAEEISPGLGKWKPLKVMWKPLACVAAGSIKDISGMKPGHYQVRARESNGKYKFTSDWSDWVYFEIPSK